MDWRGLAERLYSEFEWSRFESTCASGLSNKKICVAFSGGADSLILLLLVFERQRRNDQLGGLRALHFNHCLRGLESDGDAAFAREVCQSLGVPLSEGRWEEAPAASVVSEDQARSARLAFFASAADGAVIVTGHHRDDVVETMLMRLSRGAGLSGLSAPRRISNSEHGLCFARPLLDTGKTAIIDALEKVGAVWREDASNDGDQFYRNRLRKKVIPEWEAAADRSIAPGVAYSRELIEEDAAALEAVFEREWGQVAKRMPLSFQEIAALPAGLQRRFLGRLAEGKGVSLSRSAMEIALRALANGEGFDIAISEDVKLVGVFDEDRVELQRFSIRREFDATMTVGSVVFLSDGACLRACYLPVDGSLLNRIQRGEISHEKMVYLACPEEVGELLRVRNRIPGDAYRPMGKTSRAKVKDLMIDRKIAMGERDSLPVVALADGTILWIPGLPPNHDLRLHDGTCTALQLTYEK